MKITTKILSTAVFTVLSLSVNASDDAHHSNQLYQENCASCHGADQGGYLAPALNADTLKGRSPTALRSIIMTGSFDTLMPPFYGKLSDDDIRGPVIIPAPNCSQRNQPGRLLTPFFVGS